MAKKFFNMIPNDFSEEKVESRTHTGLAIVPTQAATYFRALTFLIVSYILEEFISWILDSHVKMFE